MAVGRITGPLLASNLLRDGVNIAVETDLLYLDVQTGRIGIKTSSPQYDLDVNGTANIGVLRVANTSTLGLLTVTKSATSGTIGSTLGPINIDPANNEKIYLKADTEVIGNLHATGEITADGNIRLGDTTSTDTLKVGAEIISNLIPQKPNTYDIGSQSQNWRAAYFQQLFTGNLHQFGNTITNVLPQNIDIIPQGGTLNIYGNVRIWEGTPLGTAPQTNNVLYVTENGSDTNDGSAMDASRACRTISGAVRSPLYKPGTSIKVAPGHYLEQNPIELKPYTSVIGSDLRTTFIEPINKTQDVFHVRSGCYIAQMNIFNGRSGRFPGTGYLADTNRGAYAVAFPPNGDNGVPVDVFQSPYIQNCTNQSGPWLYDGTMFVPNQTVQIPEGVGVATYEAGAQEIEVTLSEGEIYVGQSINGAPPNQGFFNARTLLLANKPFIQEQVVAYVDQEFGGPFQYNAVKCARDTGLIINGLGLDLVYNSTSQSVFSGLQYWSQTSSPTQIAGEETTTTNAFNYINSIAQLVVRAQAVSSPYQNTLTQVTNLPAGAIVDANRVSSLFTTATNIIVEGTAGITDKIISNGAITSNTSTQAAYNLLQANKEFLKAEAIAWISANSPGFTYDQAKCKRDVGYLVDCVSFDLLRGGNRQVIQAGTYYYGYSSVNSSIPNEQAQTIMAYNYMKNVISAVVQSQKLTRFYQSEIPQVLDNNNAGSAAAAATISSNIDLITRLVRVGPEGAPALEPIGLTPSVDAGVLNAYALLTANIDFIKAEVIAYVNTLPNFVYNKEKCYRDVGIIIENVSFDALNGGNEKSLEAGLSYYNGVTSVIQGQETQTVGAINYIKFLASKVIRNQTCPDLLSGRGSESQQINYVLTGGGIAQPALDKGFDLITGIITNGPSFAPASYAGCAVDPYLMSAEVLLQANRSFIQEEIVEFVNKSFLTYPFNTSKCRRDTGLIVDAIAMDMMYPTASDSQSTFAGIQYWKNGSYTGDIEKELTTTTNAISYLSSLAQKLILNDISGPRYQTAVTQDTSLASATVAEADIIGTDLDLVISILNDGPDGVTDKVIPNGEPLTTPGVVNAYEILQANKAYIQAEVVAYVEATKTAGFTYSQVSCSRDVGYLVDAVSFDLLHGGNRQAIQSGVYYYSFDGLVSAIPGETTQTVSAYKHLKAILANIITATTVTERYQNVVNQNVSLSAGGSNQVTTAQGLVDTIIDIILVGPSAAPAAQPLSLTQSSTALTVNAAKIISANRDFIKAEIIAYINKTFPSFRYNNEKCARDTGLLVDAIAQDLLFEGNTQSVFSGVQYWKQTGYTGAIASELTTTTSAISYVSDLAQKIVKNVTSGTRYQSTVTQNTSLPAATTIQSYKISKEFELILELINDGLLGVTDKIEPNSLVSSGDVNVIAAFDLLQANKAYIQAEAVAFVESTKTPGFVYDQSKCSRDVGYMIDSVCIDLLYGGNRQAIQSGVYYWDASTGVSAIAGEITETLDAYNYLKTIVEKVVLGIPAPRSQSNKLVQVTTLPTASDTEVTLLGSKIDKITNIIQNGPSVVTTKEPISLIRTTDANKKRAFDLLMANREFIANEIVSYINEKYNGISYSYNKAKCFRDTGLILDSIVTDLGWGSNGFTQSNFAGLQYWNQNGYTGQIQRELTTTTNAINYLSTLAQKIVQNDLTGTRYQFTVTQNISLPSATPVEAAAIALDFSTVTNILVNGTTAITDKIVSNGITALGSDAQHAYDLLQANKAYMQAEVIAWVEANKSSGFVYNSDKCSRDTSLIVDAVVQDLLFGGTSQTTFAGIQYWNQNGYVGAIASELTTTTNAVSYVSSLAQKVIQNDVLGVRYQSTVTQVVNLDPGTITEATRVASDFAVILDILQNGTAGVTDKIVPNGITEDINTNVQNAFAVLQANKAYIQAEAVAFVESTKTPGFVYDQAKCYRDVGYMIDSICIDLLYGGNRQAIQSGVYYYGYNGSSSAIAGEQTETIAAYNHIKSILSSIVTGTEITSPYQLTVQQVRTLSSGTSSEVTTSQGLIDVITNIIQNGPSVAAAPTPLGLTKSTNANVQNAAAMLLANKDFIVAETIAYINSTYAQGFDYDQAKCYRDMGYLIDSISYDILYGGNRQAVNSGVYYYGFDATASAVANEQVQTAAAYTRLKEIIPLIITNQPVAPSEGNEAEQQFNTFDSNEEVGQLTAQMVQLMVNIIQDGPSAAIDKTPIGLTENTDANIQRAMVLLRLNREFIQNEIIAWVDKTYKSGYYNYNQEKCYRDVGLIVDALSGDLLIGGNLKTIEAGVTYWTGGINVVANEIPQQNASLDYLKTVVAKVVSNQELASISGARQIINPYFSGGQYTTENLNRLIDILKTIISKGPAFAPEGYQGSGAFATSNSSVDYIQPASTVLEVTDLGGYRYKVYLSKPVLGPGSNATLFFGQTSVYPFLDKNVPDRWKQRRVDPYGSVGGALIDGAVVSKRSPIQSFVFDAYTQLNQGGIGIKITNSGYAQLVSVFTIFCGTSVIVENGGICSITNSNANFGDFCLVAKGYSKREFFGEVYNPPVQPYYPNGFFPQNQVVEVFCPDPENRPHIGQIMEVVPPEGYVNNQGLPGFLSAAVNTSTLTTGSITISGIDTEGVVIGQSIYIRDQYGSYTDINGTRYVPEGTIVTDVSFKTITLSESIASGGGEVGNPNYFTLYVSGNAYYTVRSSELAPEPLTPGTFRLGASATEQGNDQGAEEIQALQYLNNLSNKVVSNQLISAAQTTATQVTNLTLSGGDQATIRMGELFTTLQSIITNGLDAAPAIKKEGVVPPGAASASSLLTANTQFLQEEILEYINSQYFVYDHDLCRRDLGYILDGFGWDALFQSNYQAIKCGNAYLRNVPGSKYVLENEKTQTTDAINRIAALTNGLSGISTVTQAISVINLDGIYIQNIINGAGAPAYSMPNPAGLDNGVASAKSLILDNLAFIKEEVIGWIDATYPTFTYDQTKCKRDIGLVLDGVAWDLLLGTNYRSIKSGQAYFRGNAEALLANEKTQTISAFNFVKDYLLNMSEVQSSTTATQTVTNDFNNIVAILNGGIAASPAVTYTIPPGTATGFSSASQLLQANRSFIMAEVENYIHVTYPSHTYDRAKCERDVGLILDALIYDVTYGGNSMTVDAALQYFDNANNNVRVNPGEVTETVAGINYINTICQRVIQNLAPVVSYQVTVTQTFNPSWPQGSVAGPTVADLVSDIANIVQNGPVATPIIVEPSYAWASTSQKTARNAIDSDKELIASETITFINDQFTVFSYDKATCRRDMDYVIHSMIYDLIYGGNWQTVDAGLNYWRGATSLIPGEQDQTVGAFNYMLELMKKISLNQVPAQSYQNIYTQFFNPLLIDGQNAHGKLESLTVILNNIIQNGTSVAPAIEYPSTSGYSSTLLNVKNIIETQKTNLINQVITYIDNKYNGFEYNQALCKRDVGFVVEAIAADLISGGNYNTVLCGQSYYAREGTHHYVTIEDNVADATLFPDKAHINFYRRSYMSASGYLFEYVGAGSNYGALPYVGRFDPNQERETVQLNNGKVFFTSTDQNGDFRIGPGLVISQATGVLSGRTFTKSLFANLTPFILAIEG